MLLLTAATLLIFHLAATLYLAAGIRRMKHLCDVMPLTPPSVPKVSVIIPACNEAETLVPALKSVLELTYPDFEIIVINDRSVDHTADVIRSIKDHHPHVVLHEIKSLPHGWLGKSHALQYGADRAKGDYLLFTDADVIMEKTTLTRAMHHMCSNSLDHLSLIFRPSVKGGLLNASVIDGGQALMLLFRPWNTRDKNSTATMGVGAFNLVRTSAYRHIKGHSTIAMHPIDDIMLGRILKQHGFIQECLLGDDFVQVEWYKTVKDYINGLMKNMFTLHNYSILNVFGGVTLTAATTLFPFWAIFFTNGLTWIIFSGLVLLRLLSSAAGCYLNRIRPWYALFSLVSPYLHIYISIKAATITLRDNGISWRGTFYPLDQLRSGIKSLKEKARQQ